MPLRVIGTGGVIGWMLPDSIAFPNEGEPTFAYTTVQYRVSGGDDYTVNLPWYTTMTAAEIRSAAKDVIRQDVIDRLGITVPKAQIKMLNSPE